MLRTALHTGTARCFTAQYTLLSCIAGVAVASAQSRLAQSTASPPDVNSLIQVYAATLITDAATFLPRLPNALSGKGHVPFHSVFAGTPAEWDLGVFRLTERYFLLGF